MVFETIAKLINERTDTPIENITLESTFEELGIDSLDSVDLVMELEDALDVEIELDQKLEKVGDLVSFVENLKN
ncbi:MAG: acyl carrier protein [Clostridiales bacterium]|nr:acyl carrier protein [Clostridiales bacterium]